MTLASDLLPVLYDARSIMGSLGMRPHTVTRVVRYAESPRSDLDSLETPITEANGYPPKVRWLKEEEIAVGGLSAGTVEVGPMTPKFSGGGTDIALLRGDDLQPGDKLYFRITGPQHPDGALYRKTKLVTEKALRYVLQLEPVETDARPEL